MKRADLTHGYKLVELDVVQSTNTLCLEYARELEYVKTWVLARSQTKGRGSRSRHWVSEPGNLYASIGFEIPMECNMAHTFGFAFGLGVIKGLAAATRLPDMALKWPNDLLIEGKKFAGMLFENHVIINGKERKRLIIAGLGMNLTSNPENTPYPTTNLASYDVMVTPKALISALTPAVSSALEHWENGRGFETVRQQWLEHCHGLHQPMVVKTPHEALNGTFGGINDQGAILLKTPNGDIRNVTMADIFFTQPLKNKA